MTDASLTILHASASAGEAAIVREVAGALGHQVILETGVAAAMARFDARRPHLVIVDEDIDAGRGLQLVAQVRGSRHSAWVPVLVTSRHPGGHAALRHAIEAGADDCLAGPLDPELLGLRVRALQRFAAVHSGLLGIVGNVLEAIIVIDAHGIIQSFNSAAEALFGYTADEIVGLNVSRLMPSPYREQHDAYIGRYLQSGEPRIIGIGRQVVALRKNGEVFPASLAVSAVKGARAGAFIGLIRDLSADRERERYAHLALHDALTGLPNRTYFMAALDDATTRAGMPEHAFAVLFIDVDRFKLINDRFGHAVGDAVLSTIAGRLKHSVNRHDLVARLSGDEFVVLLQGVAERPQAEAVAQRLRDAIAAGMVFEGRTLQARVSVGAAVHGVDGHAGPELLRAADAAMYRFKRDTASD